MDEIILKEREVREKISEILNNSNLPSVMLKPILMDFLQVIKISEMQEYEQAKNNKEERIKKEAENETRRNNNSGFESKKL